MLHQKRKISCVSGLSFDDTRFIKADRRKFVDRPHCPRMRAAAIDLGNRTRPPMFRKPRRSKEIPTELKALETGSAVPEVETGSLATTAAEVNALIKSAAQSGTASAIKQHRLSSGTVCETPNEVHQIRWTRKQSSEAEEINQLISMLAVDSDATMDKLKERRARRRSGELAITKQGDDETVPTPLATARTEEAEPGEEPTITEFEDINRRVRADFRRRQQKLELEGEEKTSFDRGLGRLAPPSEDGDTEHTAAVGAARAVGTAKAAAKVASGVFLTQEALGAMKARISELEEQVARLEAENKSMVEHGARETLGETTPTSSPYPFRRLTAMRDSFKKRSSGSILHLSPAPKRPSSKASTRSRRSSI